MMADVDLQFEGTDFTKSYSAREILGFLQNITYDELPEQVRLFFEDKFSKFVQDPGVRQMLNTLRIHFQPRGYQNQDAEYFKDENVIEWYGGKWYEWAGKGYFPKTYTPEMVRREFINEFMNKTLIHELVHILQNYYSKQTDRPEAIAPYPAEEHPEYYNYGDVYKRDPGEQQARDVADKFDFETNKRFRKLHSLELSNQKLSWKVLPGYHHKKEFSNRTVYCNEEDQLHRTDGPAVEWANGSKWWYINDKRHRLDGPAIEYVNGEKYWYIDGEKLTERQFNQRTRQAGLKLSWKTGPGTDSPKEDWIGWKVRIIHHPPIEPVKEYEGVVQRVGDWDLATEEGNKKVPVISGTWSSFNSFVIGNQYVDIIPIEYVGLTEKESVLKFIDAVAV